MVTPEQAFFESDSFFSFFCQIGTSNQNIPYFCVPRNLGAHLAVQVNVNYYQHALVQRQSNLARRAAPTDE